MYNALIANAKRIEKLAEENLRMLRQLEKECVDECDGLPEGKLHAAKRGNYVAYYKRKENCEKTGEYIPKNRIKEARQLAQREYDEKLLNAIRRQKYHLKGILNVENELNARGMTASKMNIVDKKILTDEEYVENWEKSWNGRELSQSELAQHSTSEMQLNYCCKNENGHPIETEIYTIKGEHVRSKSECIIADTLNRMNIPYRYEAQCVVEGYSNYHPDFTCLNVRCRQSIIWEHFGLMNDSMYVENVVRKIKRLLSAGYRLGENFIFTMETASEPLSTKMIEKMIREYLL